MITGLFLVTAAIVLSGATYKAVGLRHRRSRPAVAFTIALYALGAALILRAPAIARPINDAVGVPNVTVLIGNAFTLIGACCVLTVRNYFTDSTGDRSRYYSRLWIILLGAALALMAGLFVWSLASYPDSFIQSRTPQYLAYVLIYAAYLTAVLIEACRLCLTHAQHTADWWLRLGLRLIALGGVLGILYCVTLAYNNIAVQTPLTGIGPSIVVSSILPAASCALLVIGSTIGRWGPRLGAGWSQVSDYRSYRRLEPLWRALVEVAPDVIPPQEARLTIGQKRYRRIIEIRDLILILRPYRDPALAASCAGPSEPSLSAMAAVEAAVIARAIQARREGRRPAGSMESALPPQLGADLETESRWLEAVSAALPHVPATPAEQPASLSAEDK